MLTPGHGALHSVRPLRRRHALAPIAMMSAGTVLVLLAMIGAFTH